MWELDCEEGWAPKNWCFWTLVLEKTLESPLDCKEIQQSILKEISPGIPLEGLMLKLKLQYFGHLMRRVDHWKRLWCWEGLGAGEGDDRGWDGWMASLTRWTWVWVNSGSWGWTGRPGVLWFMGSQRVRHDWVTELNWTEWLVMLSIFYVYCHLYFSLEKCLFRFFAHFWIGLLVFFIVESLKFSLYSKYQIYDFQIFSPIMWVAFLFCG